ncbi:MAG: transposase mutator type [Candidatus Magnetoglobus multicellularis str. Araruama]|uniref:Mutator family transposase n=1 Tax=Candidatus Magnetoglobus multicellularis str. Araruama TaxID=890399 RepID=A0A1V1P009_9BACT|nr:MAG: transposase mutator type [Candidatus Magnetoglobus multicellularis str. Araruama]
MTLLTPQLKAELDKCTNMEDLMGQHGLMKNMLKDMIGYMLQGEMDNCLGYQKYEAKGRKSGNSRNGMKSKGLKSSYGEFDIDIPQDRNSKFEPQIVGKYQKDISLFDDKIISMYAKGMTTRDIKDHIKEMYGIDISSGLVSNVTEKVLDLAREWQSRPLDTIYAIIYFDAIHYKVRESGKIVCKAAYTALGVNLEGKKEILGLWIGESEGAKFWLKVCNELKNRGVVDIFIACIDGLKGLPDAIKSVFPAVEIQLCIIHMIRNSIKFVPHKNSKNFCADLKKIYQAPSESKAQAELENLIQNWDDKYPLAVKPWVHHWEHLSTFFKFPHELRKLIYTTNAVESLHRQFRKITKNRALFPSDDALFKLLFLAARDISKKWHQPLRDWKLIISQLAIFFEGRFVLNS